MPVSLTALSLYTGAGGLELGIEAAGFRVLAAVESDPDCVATLRANRDWRVLDSEIQGIPSGTLLTAAGLKAGGPDLLIGGPPANRSPIAATGAYSGPS